VVASFGRNHDHELQAEGVSDGITEIPKFGGFKFKYESDFGDSGYDRVYREEEGREEEEDEEGDGTGED
jgi:hypothetical protein